MIGSLVVYSVALLLSGYALARRDGMFRRGVQRACEELVKLTPRLVCALLATGFAVKLLPADVIARFLGSDAGIGAILVGSVAGLLVPSGPMITFALAASFAKQGASIPALVSFVTAWSVFAAHRMVIFEIPLLGLSFVRLRILSVVALPPLAGALAILLLRLLGFPAQ